MSNLSTWHVSCCWLCTIEHLKISFLGSLILLRNVSVLGRSIWICIFKWITNEYSKFNIKIAVEQTLPYLLIPLFSGTPCMLFHYWHLHLSVVVLLCLITDSIQLEFQAHQHQPHWLARPIFKNKTETKTGGHIYESRKRDQDLSHFSLLVIKKNWFSR